MVAIFRFVLGLCVGSFLNVVSLRYDPDKFIFAGGVANGRSHCMHCKRDLRPWELIPLFSFLFLRGHCSTCGAKISWQYPLVELATGLIFLLPLKPFWIATLVLLLLLALIDSRLTIIPDEIQIGLLGLGIGRLLFEAHSDFAFGGNSFISRYALLFGLRENIWLNHFIAGLGGAIFFALLIFITRGRGMGWGDVKLALVLGVLYGYPDIVLLIVFAFVLGSLFGLYKIVFARGRMKTAVPFGPFLALGALILMLWGNQILEAYFHLFGII